ncbi:hypothetical protein OG308_05710 [Nocardia salmonicida]|uniref:Restriction endonuclease type IV Mrr domain-containing protein n=1 Tax=Nocardia salmonicida TaxID=53431 RepID=A0ABZ1NBI5_9NOCA
MTADNGEFEFGDEPGSLTTGERIGATLLGLASGGAGGVAVFVSDNQVGTGALLILAAAFLLMGTQGTALARFGMGENAVEFRTRQRIGLRLLQEAEVVDDPREVDALTRAAAIAAPPGPRIVGELEAYARRFGDALARVGATSVRSSGQDGLPVEFRSWFEGKQILITLKYTNRQEFNAGRISHAVDDVLTPLNPQRSEPGLLLVVNAASEDSVAKGVELIRSHWDHPAEVVVWASSHDDQKLREAMGRLAAANGQ